MDGKKVAWCVCAGITLSTAFLGVLATANYYMQGLTDPYALPRVLTSLGPMD